MVTSRWIVLGTAGLLLSGGGAAAAVVAAGSGGVPQPVTQVHRYYELGPSAKYTGDLGAIGVVNPTRVTTPTDAASYDAVVELSYGVLTRGPGPFRATLDVEPAGSETDPDNPGSDDAPTLPTTVRLAPSARDGEPGVVRFLVPDLAPGTTYRISPRVNSTSTPQGRNVVRLSRLLLTAELTAS